MTDKDDKGDVFDVLDKASELYDEYSDDIREFLGGDDTLDLDDYEPLKRVMVEDDFVKVAVDAPGMELDEINLDIKGSIAEIGINGDSVTVQIPDDVVMEDVDAKVNNGVLEVEMPREGGD